MAWLLVRRVAGESMLPSLPPGRLVWAVRRQRIRPGDVVIFRHAGREKIKRVAKVDGEQLYVLGDNPELSTDSRDFGWLLHNEIIATVVWPRITPLADIAKG